MNEQSLKESNAILEAAVARADVGELIPATPGELADEAGITNRLSAARAIRALLARGRLAAEGDGYRLVDARPVEAGEPATVRRPSKPRRRKDAASDEPQIPTYEQVGRLVIERLVELTAENAELRTAVDRAHSEAQAARSEAMEITRSSAADRRRADALEDEVATLKRRLEMTEGNLRNLVQAARQRRSSPIDDGDARAILDILATTNEAE